MQSLVDVAQAVAASPATLSLSLADFARTQASSKPPPLSLVDVAKRQASTSLERLAQTIADEDAKRVEQALAAAAQDVVSEQRELRAGVLNEAAAEMRCEEAQAAQTLVAKIERAGEASAAPTAPGGGVPIRAVRGDDDDDGYSSFGDDGTGDDDDDAAAKTKASTKPRKQALEEDGESEGESASGPERTTASDSPESKAFLRAVYRADARKVQEMLESGDASATTADQHGWSGLHWAASQGHTKILELLLARGAAIDAVEHVSGWTALHVAAVRELLPCVKLLLQSGANLRVKDAYGDSAFAILKSVRGKKRERFLQTLAQFAHGA